VENSNNIVYFGKINRQSDIEKLYKKGVFFFLFGSEIIEYINESNTFLVQNKKSIQEFDSAINYVKYLFDTSYNSTLFYDTKKILTYKKVYLKFSYKNLGKRDLLIPDISNYECCYSNKKISARCYFITEVIEFKIF
jgi:hypothetical protein